MKNAVPVKDVLVPISEPVNGWLEFTYSSDDCPWEWPRVIEYNGQLYRWMSYNSDRFAVCYKITDATKVAKPVLN